MAVTRSLFRAPRHVAFATILALGVLSFAAPAAAASFTVTSTADHDDGACDADCTLREAVIAANNAPGADTITLPAGVTITLSIGGVEASPAVQWDLDVAENLTILGNGSTITTAFGIDNLDTHIFEVAAPGVNLTLRRLTLTGASALGGGAIEVTGGGLLTLQDSAFTNNTASVDGGAVFLADSDAIVVRTRFENNQAPQNGGAIGTSDHQSLTITGSTFVGNHAGANGSGLGGAVHASGSAGSSPSELDILSSTFTGNYTEGSRVSQGGAIAAVGGLASIEDSSIIGNGSAPDGSRTTEQGGGVYAVTDGELRIDNSSVDGNFAAASGGGIYVDNVGGSLVTNSTIAENDVDDGRGGGILTVETTTQLFNVTISGNTSAFGGGGIQAGLVGALLMGSTVELTHVTLADNVGEAGIATQDSTVSLASTLVAGNTAVSCAGSGYTSAGFNLEDTATCSLTAASDQPSTPPGFGALAFNGGEPQGAAGSGQGRTHALVVATAPVDGADPATCGTAPVDRDERSVGRPQGPACDIGAYELGEFPPPGTSRCDGENRIETSITCSQEVFDDSEAHAVVLTRSDLFPDAQAGTPLAIQKNAPMLLSEPAFLNPATEAEINRILDPGETVYLLGGTAALSGLISARVVALGYQAIRFGGVNRFETAAIIADLGLGNPHTLLAANGLDFPDSVVAGAAAVAAGGAAIILTAGTSMPSQTQAYLDSRTDDPEIIAIGGGASFLFPGRESLVGANRYETAVAVAERFFLTPSVVGVATGANFADGLTGGAIVGRADIGPGPMLLTDGASLPSNVATYLSANTGTITAGVIFGGTGAVSQNVEDQINAIL